MYPMCIILYCKSESEGVYAEQCCAADKTETENTFLSAQLNEQLKNKRMLLSENQIELSTTIGQGLCVSMHHIASKFETTYYA